MSTRQDYQELIRGVESRGGFTTLRTDDDGEYSLVCASHRRSDGSLGGNSFWVWRCSHPPGWYLSTWSPRAYFVPPFVDLVQVCMECLALARRAMYAVPDEIVAKYQLREIKIEELYSLLERSEAG